MSEAVEKSTELTAEIQNLLREILDQVSRSKLDRSNFDRLDMFIEACPDETLHPRFRQIANSLSKNRQSYDLAKTSEAVESLWALLETELKVDAIKFRSVGDLNVTSFFEPSNEDRKSMLEKCAEIRQIVHESSVISQEFRNRLLKRIAAMEIEINREKGLYDVILGGVSDAGEILGKFGNDVKPVVERMKEIKNLGRRSSTEYSSLPSPEEQQRLPPPAKKLPKPPKE